MLVEHKLDAVMATETWVAEVWTLVEGFEVWPGFAMLSSLNDMVCQHSARSLRLLGLEMGEGGVGQGKDGTIRSEVGIVGHDKQVRLGVYRVGVYRTS